MARWLPYLPSYPIAWGSASVRSARLGSAVLDAKLEKHGPAVINRCLALLRTTMNYAAVHWEEAVKVIAWKKMSQREPKAREIDLSPDEARRLMDLLPEHIALGFAFTLYTGVRLHEMATMTWDRVDWHRGVVSVITKARGTETVMRLVWLSEKAMRILVGMKRSQPDDPALVFNMTNHRKHWLAARKRIGRDDIHWHDLRAMTATWARQYAGKDLRLIGQALGHAGTKVTERYARVVDHEIVDMLNQLPDISPQSVQPEQLSKVLSIE